MSFDQDPNEQANISGADFAIMCDEIAALKQQNAELLKDAERYQELLYAVQRKFPNESRHETALRYIRRMEEPTGVCGAVTSQAAWRGSK